MADPVAMKRPCKLGGECGIQQRIWSNTVGTVAYCSFNKRFYDIQGDTNFEIIAEIHAACEHGGKKENDHAE